MLEHQPVGEWQDKALAETSPDASINALLALARAGGATDFGPDGWQEPLEVLCASLRSEAGLSRFGVVSLHAVLAPAMQAAMV